MLCMYIIHVHVHINIYLYHIQERYGWEGPYKPKKKRNLTYLTSRPKLDRVRSAQIVNNNKMSVTVPCDRQADPALTVCSGGDLICHTSSYLIFLVSSYLSFFILLCVVSQSAHQLTLHAQ